MTGPRDIWMDPDDLPTTFFHMWDRPDGAHESFARPGPSINEMRRRWRRNNLEPRLLAALRRRIENLEGRT
jgi:hypothetical protein